MSRRHKRLDRGRWHVVRKQALERDGWRCQGPGCGKPGRIEVDHRIPLHKGGAAYELANLQTLCRGCHIAKTRAENTRPLGPLASKWRVLVEELN